MKPHRLLLAGTALSVICGAFGYHHLATAKANPVNSSLIQNTTASIPTPAALQPTAVDINRPALEVNFEQPTSHATQQVSKAALTGILDQVIDDAIQRGTLDPNRLTSQQLALLPEKFRRKNDDPTLSEEEIAHVEQQIALGDDAPPDPPPPFPCPDPNHLPDNYNNDYNKMILRQRGCQL